MKKLDIAEILRSNSYPGRGIIIGRKGDFAVTAYFIMGRSENSRNRVFVEEGDGIRTQAFDPSKLTDPHLIIYSPVRVLGNKMIITNGDQTDTTPRISGILHFEDGGFNYAMSIIKSADGNPDSCQRFTFSYNNPLDGEGHFIHTYMGNGTPLPSFEGEPEPVAINQDIDEFTETLWTSLNEDNKISLFVRYVNTGDCSTQTRIINKNK